MLFNPFDLKPIYNVCEKPPTLYSLLESIVNYGKDDKTKIKDLAKEGRSAIFNFDYPLSSNINKQDFECMILNHFIMRRIGFQTPTAFKIQLNVKLNEIMPMYNKMFNMIEGWDIFKDGEEITRIIQDTTNENNNIAGTGLSQNSLTNSSSTSSSFTNDKRHSDAPQDNIQDVKDGSYVSDYSYNTENNNANDNSQSTGSSSSSSSTQEDKNKISNKTETITRTPSDKIRLYKEFMENRQSIYSLIFKELECLFLQII